MFWWMGPPYVCLFQPGWVDLTRIEIACHLKIRFNQKWYIFHRSIMLGSHIQNLKYLAGFQVSEWVYYSKEPFYNTSILRLHLAPVMSGLNFLLLFNALSSSPPPCYPTLSPSGGSLRQRKQKTQIKQTKRCHVNKWKLSIHVIYDFNQIKKQHKTTGYQTGSSFRD